MTDPRQELVELTANIVSAYLSNNPTPGIRNSEPDQPGACRPAAGLDGRTETPLEPAKPAVSIKKSMTPEYRSASRTASASSR